MSVLYTTQFPPNLNNEADIKLHESRVAKGPEATGLALKGGTVLRYVEFSPGYTVRLDPTHPRGSRVFPPSTHVPKKEELGMAALFQTAPSLISLTFSA